MRLLIQKSTMSNFWACRWWFCIFVRNSSQFKARQALFEGHLVESLLNLFLSVFRIPVHRAIRQRGWSKFGCSTELRWGDWSVRSLFLFISYFAANPPREITRGKEMLPICYLKIASLNYPNSCLKFLVQLILIWAEMFFSSLIQQLGLLLISSGVTHFTSNGASSIFYQASQFLFLFSFFRSVLSSETMVILYDFSLDFKQQPGDVYLYVGRLFYNEQVPGEYRRISDSSCIFIWLCICGYPVC